MCTSPMATAGEGKPGDPGTDNPMLWQGGDAGRFQEHFIGQNWSMVSQTTRGWESAPGSK